ncbi:MAG TPA: ABC-2 family transporter protein [Limnochordia bacterium]|nr:ABC-2 family transporter protein [Limnochordia bacterium]
MFTEAKRVLKFFFQYFSANLQSAMEYRGAFFSQVVFMFLNNLMLLFFWWVFFTQVEALNGWLFEHVLLLYAVASGAYACQALFFGGSFSLSRAVSEGRLDFYLALPKPVLLHVLISRSSASAWGDLCFSLVIFVLTAAPTPGQLLGFLLLIFTGGVVTTSFAVLAHSLSFWLGQSAQLADQLTEALLTFSLYPEGIFSAATRVVLYTLIPAGFVSYLPVRILQDFTGIHVGLLLLFALGLLLTARTVFYRGLRRYESGNLVVLNALD